MPTKRYPPGFVAEEPSQRPATSTAARLVPIWGTVGRRIRPKHAVAYVRSFPRGRPVPHAKHKDGLNACRHIKRVPMKALKLLAGCVDFCCRCTFWAAYISATGHTTYNLHHQVGSSRLFDQQQSDGQIRCDQASDVGASTTATSHRSSDQTQQDPGLVSALALRFPAVPAGGAIPNWHWMQLNLSHSLFLNRRTGQQVNLLLLPMTGCCQECIRACYACAQLSCLMGLPGQNMAISVGVDVGNCHVNTCTS